MLPLIAHYSQTDITVRVGPLPLIPTDIRLMATQKYVFMMYYL